MISVRFRMVAVPVLKTTRKQARFGSPMWGAKQPQSKSIHAYDCEVSVRSSADWMGNPQDRVHSKSRPTTCA